MKKVFYLECSGEHWASVANTLNKKHNWQPVLWTAMKDSESAIKNIYHDTVFQESYSAIRGIPLPFDIPLKPLDGPLLKSLAETESLAIQMMDRMDPNGITFPYVARRKHYLNLLRYWYSVLLHMKPDIVIFPLSPHVVYDFITYHLCRYIGIKTLMFERPGLPKRLFAVESFEDGSPELPKAIEEITKKKEIVLSPETLKYLDESSCTTAKSTPVNYQKKLLRLGLSNNKGQQKKLSSFSSYLLGFKRAAYILLRTRILISENYIVVSNKSPEHFPNTLEWLYYFFSGLQKKIRLKKLHDKLSSSCNIDFNQPYVFLALHYQPERATLPMGAQFSDQLLIVDILSRLLPKGWKVYVKEHPWQLQPLSKGEYQRNDDFYHKVCSYNNVVLVNSDIETPTLLQHAKAVATITGSVGWQGLCQAKPVLIFGCPWYKDCKGVYSIYSSDDCEAAMHQLVTNTTMSPTRHDLMAFLAALESISVEGTLEPFSEDTEGLNMNKVIVQMASSLHNKVNK